RSAGAGFYSGTEKICFPAHGGSFLKCEAANCIAKARNVYATGLVVGRSHPLRNIQRTFWSPKWSPTGDHGPVPDGTQRCVRPIFAIQINTCQDRTKRVGTAVNKFRVRCFQPLSHLSKPLNTGYFQADGRSLKIAVCYPFAPFFIFRRRFIASRTTRSTRPAASACMPGKMWLYRSSVIATLEWPSRSWAIFG